MAARACGPALRFLRDRAQLQPLASSLYTNFPRFPGLPHRPAGLQRGFSAMKGRAAGLKVRAAALQRRFSALKKRAAALRRRFSALKKRAAVHEKRAAARKNGAAGRETHPCRRRHYNSAPCERQCGGAGRGGPSSSTLRTACASADGEKGLGRNRRASAIASRPSAASSV